MKNNKIYNQVYFMVMSKEWSQVGNRVWDQVSDQVDCKIMDYVRRQMWKQMGYKSFSFVKDRIKGQLENGSGSYG